MTSPILLLLFFFFPCAIVSLLLRTRSQVPVPSHSYSTCLFSFLFYSLYIPLLLNTAAESRGTHTLMHFNTHAAPYTLNLLALHSRHFFSQSEWPLLSNFHYFSPFCASRRTRLLPAPFGPAGRSLLLFVVVLEVLLLLLLPY